ncbi:Rieske 2Fe-2S domain-containing protein [Paludisphaera sp.]|uniref:Rieske (2Fe-2S) protein n=1 Tax=Paludisphaera sp. TaxID=2017432 RepID=UPI00301D4467
MSKFVKMATLGELPAGGAKEVEHEGRIYALFNVDGRISCIDGFCPHQGGPLAEGELDGCMVACPWHGWEFNVQTGDTPMGPRLKVDVFEVKIEGDEVLVLVPES